MLYIQPSVDNADFSAYKNIPAMSTYTQSGRIRGIYKDFAKCGASEKEISEQTTKAFSKGVMERKMTHDVNQITSSGMQSKKSIFDTIAEKAQSYVKKGVEFVKAHKVASAIAAGAILVGGVVAGVAAHNSKKAEKSEEQA